MVTLFNGSSTVHDLMTVSWLLIRMTGWSMEIWSHRVALRVALRAASGESPGVAVAALSQKLGFFEEDEGCRVWKNDGDSASGLILFKEIKQQRGLNNEIKYSASCWVFLIYCWAIRFFFIYERFRETISVIYWLEDGNFFSWIPELKKIFSRKFLRATVSSALLGSSIWRWLGESTENYVLRHRALPMDCE